MPSDSFVRNIVWYVAGTTLLVCAIVTCKTHGSVHAVRTEICRALLCRVHCYLLCFAIMVCLMGHIAVQTYRVFAGLGIRSCMLVSCSRSRPLTSASQKLSNIVLFERCFLDIEQFQTHHFQQFLVTSNGVASTTFAFIDIEYGRSTPSTQEGPSCLLHWRQIRQHVIGFQQVVFSGRSPTATVAMNSPSASRLTSSHWGILS